MIGGGVAGGGKGFLAVRKQDVEKQPPWPMIIS